MRTLLLLASTCLLLSCGGTSAPDGGPTTAMDTGASAADTGTAPLDAGAPDTGTCQDLGTACTAPSQCCTNKCNVGFCCGISGTPCENDHDCCPGSCKPSTNSPTGKRCQVSA